MSAKIEIESFNENFSTHITEITVRNGHLFHYSLMIRKPQIQYEKIDSFIIIMISF